MGSFGEIPRLPASFPAQVPQENGAARLMYAARMQHVFGKRKKMFPKIHCGKSSQWAIRIDEIGKEWESKLFLEDFEVSLSEDQPVQPVQ